MSQRPVTNGGWNPQGQGGPQSADLPFSATNNTDNDFSWGTEGPPEGQESAGWVDPWKGGQGAFKSSVDWSQFSPGGTFGDGGGGGGGDDGPDPFANIGAFDYSGPSWDNVNWDNISAQQIQAQMLDGNTNWENWNAPDAVDPSQVTAQNVQTPDQYQASQYGGTPQFSYGAFQPGMDQFTHERFVAPDAEAVMNDPGYQFRLQQGQKALERSAAARGALNTGGTLANTMDYSQGLASQEYQNAYNRALGEYQMGYGQSASEHDREYARRMGEHQQGLSQESGIAAFNAQNQFRDWQANEAARFGGAQFNAANQLQAGGMNQAANLQAQMANQGAGLQAGLANNQMALNAAQLNQSGQFQAAGMNQQAAMANQSAALQAAGMNQASALDAARINQAGLFGAAGLNQAGQFGAWDRGFQGYQTGYDYALQDAYRQREDQQSAASAAAGAGTADRNWAYKMAQDQYGRDWDEYNMARDEYWGQQDRDYTKTTGLM
jgi:hypothetical protein